MRHPRTLLPGQTYTVCTESYKQVPHTAVAIDHSTTALPGQSQKSLHQEFTHTRPTARTGLATGHSSRAGTHQAGPQLLPDPGPPGQNQAEHL